MGSWRHLIGRFFRVIWAAPLSEAEAAWVAVFLPAEAGIFFDQPVVDQRHGYEAAQRMGERPDLIRAALLHDVGKRHARLSPLARALVSAASKLRLPVGPRGRGYLRHGELAAQELAELGVERLVIDFAANHHAERPETITIQDWEALAAADR